MGQLSLTNIDKDFNGHSVIKGLNLEIAEGEFMVFVGPSGCGKSTLLRMIAGLEQLSAGDMRLDGVAIQDLPPANRGIAMVFQNYALYPHMTVAENIGFTLKMAGMPKSQINDKVMIAAKALQLEGLLTRYPKELSGGQRQRVAIGRAIVRKPSIFLFDEPLSNLDAALRVQMRIEITRLHQSLKNTMIYVTHDQVEAMTMGQRIAIFNAGRIEQVGVPMDLYERPANEFVAGFLGTPKINFMATSANVSSKELILLGHHVLSDLPKNWNWEAASKVARIGVRPEHWHLSEQGVGLKANLELSEHLGDAVLLHVRIEGMEDLLTLKLAKLPYPIIPGSQIWLQPELEHIILFNEQAQRIAVTPE